MALSTLQKLKLAQAEKHVERPKIKAEDVHINLGVKRDFERGEKQLDREEKAILGTEATEAREKFQHGLDETMQAVAADAALKNITLDASQMNGLRGVLRNQVSCVIGAAGTGKTTLTRIIISELGKRVRTIDLREVEFITITNPDGTKSRVRVVEYEKNNRNAKKQEAIGVAGASYTGRAAQQFKKALPTEYQRMVSTMHSLLGYAPVFEEREYWDDISKAYAVKEIRIFRPTFTQYCKLPYSVYIIDEASMMPIPLWNEFIAAIHPTSRILIIGDIHQLPPVMGKGVLGYALQKWPTFELTTIHRQAAGNAIITNAHRILKGQMISPASNFQMFNSNKPSALEMQTYVRQVMVKLRDLKRYDPFRDTIITPWNKGPLGTLELNEYFMTVFNPEKYIDGVCVNKRVRIHTGTGQVEYALGDKVMILNNINNVDPPITNGMMGIVESINFNGKYDLKRSQIEDAGDDAEMSADDFSDVLKADFKLEEFIKEEKEEKEDESLDQRQSSHIMTIRFETGATYQCSTAGDYRRVTLGYVITCHKAQGGEYPNVFIICHSAHSKMLSQEWLYTAVTRAKQSVYLLYNKRGLEQSIQRQRIKGHTLAEKIKSYVIEAKADDAAEMNDPFNVDTGRFPILFNPKEV